MILVTGGAGFIGTNFVLDWLYVKDNCAAILSALEPGAPGEVCNINHWSEKASLEVVHTIYHRIDVLSTPSTHHLPFPQYILYRPSRPRTPLRHRRARDRARTALEAGRDLRERHPKDSAVESPRRPDWVRSVQSGDVGATVFVGSEVVKQNV